MRVVKDNNFTNKLKDETPNNITIDVTSIIIQFLFY